MAKMTDNKPIHLKDIVKRVIDIVVYEDIKDAHFLNFLECPDDVEDIEDSEEVIYLDMSDEQLKQFTPEQVHKFTNIELLDKINNVYKEALNEKQVQTLINLNKQQFTITKEDVQVLLDKLKLCKTIKVERRTKNNNFYNQYNITDSDALNIIHQLKVEDYCANTKSVNLKHLNNNLMIFEPTVEIHKFKVSLVLYIKLDVDETTGDTVVLVSIHEATTQDPLPYLKGNKNTLISSKNCNINMKGEFLMEDNKTTIKSNGIYSVLNNKWIKEPTKESIPSIDEEELSKELKPWEDRYLALVNKIKEEPIKMTEATLNEFTTSRVYKYITEGNFVMMSAYKSDLSTKENKANQQELMDSIRKLGLGYVQFNSAYVVNRDSKDSLVSKEEGLLIPNMKKEDAFKLAEKYRQDTIIYGSEGKVQELCTTPFEGHNKGDIVTTYNVSDKDKTLNIQTVMDLFAKRKKEGAYSKSKHGNVKFTLEKIEEILQPSGVTFTKPGEVRKRVIYTNPLAEESTKIKIISEEDAKKAALKELKSHKNIFAVVYGYQRGKESPVYFQKPLLKKTFQELRDYSSAMTTSSRGANDITIYSLYKSKEDSYEF